MTDKRVSLVFMGQSRQRCPSNFPIWALAWDQMLLRDIARQSTLSLLDPRRPDVARWYEIHDRKIWTNAMPAPFGDEAAYLNHLNALPGQVVMAKQEPDVKNCIVYPMHEVQELPHVDTYLCSTMAYMLCHAVLNGYLTIGIYGADFYPRCEWQELIFERPNLAYLIGLFRGQGVEIIIPQESDLWQCELLDDISMDLMLRHGHQHNFKKFHYLYRYGLALGRGEQINLPFNRGLFDRPWKMEYYGVEKLEDCGATPKRYAAEILKEMGVAAQFSQSWSL